MSPSVRLATAADAPAVAALCRLLDVGDEPGLDDAQARRAFEALTARPEHRIYVAERAGRIVGSFALIFVGGLAHGGRDSCIVEDVVVAPDCRGGGIGRTMMRHAMAACAERGCYKLVLSSHVDRDAAHRFYERLGFRRHGYSFLVDG